MESRIEFGFLVRVDFVETFGDTARTMRVDKLGNSRRVQLASRNAQALGNLFCFGEEWVWERDRCFHMHKV